MRTVFLLVAYATLFCNIIKADENDLETSTEDVPETTTDLLRTESRRVARQLNIPGQEYVVRGHSGNRQIIKIPSNAKVKVLQQPQAPPQKRIRQQQVGPQQGYKPKHQQKSGRPKRGPYEEVEEEYYDDADYSATNKKPKRTKSGFMVKDISPEEFYSEAEDYEVFQKKPKKKAHKNESYNYRNQPKKYRKQQYHSKYADTASQSSQVVERPERRPQAPHYDEESGYDFVRPANRYRSQQESPVVSSSGYHDDSSYGYHDYTAASSITMKQVAPPNLAPGSLESHHELRKETHSVKKPHAVHSEHVSSGSQNGYEDYQHVESEPTYSRKTPSTRQIQSIFPQQYTTHNPFITRNLGLDDNERSYNHQYREEQHSGHQSLDDGHHHLQHHHQDYHGVDDHEHEHQYVPAASEQRPSLVPTGSSGIHIVNPPQFNTRDQPQQQHPSVNGQRATIRDIIRQDCPEAEKLGFCASPPRYPTQQTHNIVKKCSEMLDAMYSPAPIESEDDLSSFSSRSDSETDIEFVDGGNNITGPIEKSWSQWSRSSNNDGSNTVCESVLTQTEPGYAREVSSGRWFVIMQTMDHIVQRIMTDTCERPNKPCAGLAGLKCSRTSNFHHGYKATRCVQRYTQQRLISWDPELPQACPKVRIFRFPTACLCHLSVD